MVAGGITRRRAVALGLASGAAAVVPWSRTALAGAPGGDPFAVTLSSADLSGSAIKIGRRFELVGLRGAGIAAARPRVRGRRSGGAWGPWLTVGVGGHGPDAAARSNISEPVWTGPADELQIRLDGPGPRGRWELVLVPQQQVPAVARAAQSLEGAPAIVTRAQWGAAAVPPRGEATYGDVRMAFVHHTVNANNYSPAQAAGVVLAITRYHRYSNGWKDVGYNFLVDRFGTIYEGRAGGIDQAVVGAQAGGWNSISTGVSIIGTFDSAEAPEAAVDAVARLLAWKLSLHAVPVNGSFTVTSSGGSANRYRAGTLVRFQRISGHRDGCSTDCPGNTLYAQLDEIRAKAQVFADEVVGAQPRALITLEDTPRSVPYGSELTVQGAVRSAATGPLSGMPVALQKRGAKGWTTVARGTTDTAGRYRIALAWKRGGRLRAAVTDAQGSVASRSVRVACTPAVTAAVKASRVMFGRKAVVTGRLVPAAPARLLVERQGRDGRYRQIASVPVRPSGDGAFRVSVRLVRPALHRLRVSVGAHNAVEAAASPRLFVRAVRRL